MRNTFFAVLFCLVVIVPAFAQDLSEFEKKGWEHHEVMTERFVQDLAAGDTEEHREYSVTRFYDLDGQLRTKNSNQGTVSEEAVYLTEFDKDGKDKKVIRRTETRTVTLGNDKSKPSKRVWEYAYDETGACTVVCTEVEEEKPADQDDPNPTKELLLSETWQLDSAGRVLKYSKALGDKEAFRVVFERDKDGRLLTKERLCGELLKSKETFTYRDDGTLKESDEMDFVMNHTKKQYGPSGKERDGQVVNKDGKVIRDWTVERSVPRKLKDGSAQEETTYWIHGADKDKVVLTIRYVVTTTQYK